MSWIADYDTHGMEFPTCVHVTKTTMGMTHGATYIPIQVSKDVRADNTKLRELVADLWLQLLNAYDRKEVDEFADRIRELGIEIDDGVS